MLIPFGVFSAGAISGGGGGAGSFELISSTILTGSQASVTFDVTGLGSTYKHLQVRWTGRSTFSSDVSSIVFRLNSDTGSNYSYHRLIGTGSSVISDAGTSATYGDATYVTANNATSGNFAAGVTDILDAFSSSKYKTVKTLGGATGGTNRIDLSSGSWRNIAAVTGVTFFAYDGSLNTGSRFSIYGIRG